jgi:hypothetical protein
MSNKDYVIVNLDVSMWTGEKKIDAVDIGLSESEVPEIVTLGHKKTINPERMRAFKKLRTRARTRLETVGTTLPFGYLIPMAEAVAAAKDLITIQTEWDQEKESLKLDYAGEIEAWIQKHPQQEAAIRAAAVPWAEVDKQLRFRFQPYKASAFEGLNPQDLAILNQGFVQAIESAYGKLLRECSLTAKKVVKALGNENFGQKGLRPLKAMVQKLQGLSFLDQRIRPLYEGIEKLLSEVPQSGYLDNASVGRLSHALSGLTDPQEIERRLSQGMPVISPVMVVTPAVPDQAPLIDDDEDDVELPVQVARLVPAAPSVVTGAVPDEVW